MPDYKLPYTGKQIESGLARGIDLDGLPTGRIPKKEGTTIEASAILENADRVVSDKDFEVPPDTIWIGEGTGLSGAVRAVSLKSEITGNTALVLAQLFDDNGFQKAFAYSGGAAVDLPFNTPEGAEVANTADFLKTTTADELLTGFTVKTNQISKTIPAEITIRSQSSTGTIAFHLKDTITTNSSGIAFLDMKSDHNPILFDNGEKTHIKIDCEGMLGKTVDGVFIPNLVVKRIVVVRKEIVLKGDVVTGSMTWQQIVQAATDDTTGTKLDASHIDNLPSGDGSMTGAEIVQAIDSDASSPKVPFKNLAGVAPDSVTAKVTANEQEIGRLKTDISTSSLPVFAWRGRGIPTIPTDKHRAFYIHSIVLPDALQVLNIPSGMPEGAVFSYENNDRSKRATIVPPAGETINGGAITYAADQDTLSFFVKTGTDWVEAFGGVFPNTMASLRSTIQALLPNSLHTVDEIAAQLKDRLHTFKSIQDEFHDKLFTRAEGLPTGAEIVKALENSVPLAKIGVNNIDGLTAASYVETSQAVNIDPIGKTYLAYKYTGTGAVTQTMPNLVNSRDQLRYIVHNDKSDGSVITLLPANSGEKVDGTTSYDLDADTTAIFVAMKGANNWYLETLFDHSGGAVAPTGINIDDGTSDVADIRRVNIKGMKLSEVPNAGGMGANEAEITAGVNIHMKAPNQQYGSALANEIVVMPPLSTFVDPDQTGAEAVVLEIEHDAFEPMHKPSYLAYLAEDEEIVGKIMQGYENTAGSHHDGAIWFDDIICPAGAYIETRKADKSYGIQEADELDPNVTGGTDYLIAARVHMKGTAPSDGFARVYLYNKSLNPFNPKGYLLDKNGQPMAVERHYKTGQELGVLDVIGVVNAKGLQEFSVHVVDSFTNDVVILTDRTEGASGLMIQAISSEEKTGHGLLQFESDTNQNIEFSSHYLGVDRMNLNWINARAEAPVSYTAGTNFVSINGWRLINPNGIKVGVVDGHTHIQDDGVHIAEFNYGKVFSAEETVMLRGKDIEVTATLVDKDNGFNVALIKWTGKPDEYTPEIFTVRDGGGSPEFQTNWAQADSLFISEDVVSGDHTLTKVMVVPADANNYAIVIYPVVAQEPITLKLKQLKVDVSPAFTGYALKAPELLNELHLVLGDEHKQFIQNTQGYASLRYTINQNAQGMPMPVGIPQKGAADITLDDTVNQVPGSAAKGGEGAIKFGDDGRARIVTQLRLWNEQSTDNDVKFWWAEVGPGNQMTKLADSEFTFTVPANSKDTLHSFGYTHDFELGDRIALRASATKADGAFLQCVDDSRPMVDVTIDFKELVADPGDDPTTGVDISAFSKYFAIREAVSYIFIDESQFTIDVTIPEGVEMAVLGTFSQDVDGTIRPIKSPDYRYVPPASPDLKGQLIFDLGRKYTGEIILEFLA